MEILGTEPEPSSRSANGDDDQAPQGTGLSRRASLNAAAAGLDFGARTVIELVLNPLMLHGLGDYLFGAWRILWRLTGYLWATSGRAAQALQSAVANRLQSEDTDEKKRFVGASVVVWALYSPLLAVAVVLAMWKLPGLLDAPSGLVSDLRWTILLLGVDAIVLSLFTIPRATLQGENLGYRRMGLSTVLVIVSGLLTAVALWLDLGIVGVATVNLLATVYTGAVFWRIARVHVRWFGAARPRAREVRWFFGLSSWFMLWKLVNQLMMSGDVLVLGVLGSVELVTTYSLTKFIPEATPPVARDAGHGRHPRSRRHHRRRRATARARRVRGDVLSFTWLFGVAFAVSILLWNESFVRMWVGEEYFAGRTELLLLMISLLQLALIRSDALIIDTTLNVGAKTLAGLGSAVLALVIAGVLIGRYDMGIAGLCVGLIVGRAILNAVYPVLVGAAIDHPFRDQLRSAFRPFVTTGGLLMTATLASPLIAVDSWPLLVAGSAATAIATLTVAFRVGLDGPTRRRIVKRARLMTGRAPS